MRLRTLHVLTILLAAQTAATASAQMIIDRKIVSSEAAKAMGEACEAFARENGWAVSVWVLDAAGHSTYMYRMQGAPWLSVEPSRMKAQTALQTGRPSSQYEARARERGDFMGPNMAILLENFMAHGGLPVIVDGQVAGAIGVGGAPPGGDEACAQAGIDAIMN